MKWAARAAALAIVLIANLARAEITYISQERLIKDGTYSVPRTPPFDPLRMPFYTVTTITAPDMGPFSASLGPMTRQISSFDQSGIRARGESGDMVPTGPIGNYLHYTYGFSQTKVVFEVDEPTPFISTPKFPNFATTHEPVSLSGPGGQSFDLSDFNPVSGVLSPGTWTFSAVADAHHGKGYNLEVSFVPEPSGFAIVAGMLMVGVRRRRK